MAPVRFRVVCGVLLRSIRPNIAETPPVGCEAGIMIRVRVGGTPNGVMKLPGRVMAGGVVPAGGFCFFFLFLFAPPRPGPSRTRDPPATHPRLTRPARRAFK